MSPGARWLLAIGGLLVANIVAMVILTVSAHADQAQIIPAYYDQAVHYDDAIDTAAQSRKLAWQADTKLRDGAIDIAVRDASGAPLTDAHVRVSGYQRAHAAQRYDLVLGMIAPGRYRVPARLERGVHDVTVTIERGTERFVDRVSTEVP
ncbi:MAG TPA: FixH family protein [Kofleriaceae bacterium]|nr:FixH family protein [Kofleriaceae bacterium]